MPMNPMIGSACGPGMRADGATAAPHRCRALVAARLEIVLQNRMQLVARLSDRDAGLQPSDRGHPHRVVTVEHRSIGRAHVRVHRHRHPEVRADDRRAGESLLRDADDRIRPVVQADRLPDEIAARAEPARPELVGEHDDRVRIEGLVFLGKKEPSERGTRSRDLEVVPRDQRGEHPLGRLRVAQAHDLRPELIRRDPVEERGSRPHRLEERIAEVVEPLTPRAAADVDERRRIDDTRARPQQNRVGEAEDRRRAGDAGRERQHGRNGEDRASPKEPQGVPEVEDRVHEVVRPVPDTICFPKSGVGSVPEPIVSETGVGSWPDTNCFPATHGGGRTTSLKWHNPHARRLIDDTSSSDCCRHRGAPRPWRRVGRPPEPGPAVTSRRAEADHPARRPGGNDWRLSGGTARAGAHAEREARRAPVSASGRGAGRRGHGHRVQSRASQAPDRALLGIHAAERPRLLPQPVGGLLAPRVGSNHPVEGRRGRGRGPLADGLRPARCEWRAGLHADRTVVYARAARHVRPRTRMARRSEARRDDRQV